MPAATIITNFEKTRSLARGSRWKRFMNDPVRYCIAMAQKKIFYPLTGYTRNEAADLFWGGKMLVSLPAGTDIYLTGGRTDDAELRLTFFLLHTLHTGSVFLDIGAHFGFYSLLAQKAGATAHAMEPSAASFRILKQNAAGKENLYVYPLLAGETDEQKDFCVFEPKFSEYDSVYADQYKDRSWFSGAGRKFEKVRCVTLDFFTKENDIHPDIIKIDTEGSEADIINGAMELLTIRQPLIIVEYLSEERGNNPHKKALEALTRLGYKCHVIQDDGTLAPCPEPDVYLKQMARDSENLVLKRG